MEKRKRIKIKLVGFWDINPKNYIVFQLLEKNYDVSYVESDPDYVFCSVFGDKYGYLNYPQVRIMISAENYIPDYNYIDYSICSYPIMFQDRNFRITQLFLDEYSKSSELQFKNRDYDISILKSKIYFANFISSHDSEFSLRGEFYRKLSEYKRIESCGSFLNNMPDNKVVRRQDDSKIKLQSKTKFTICFESTKHEGFITEKIADAFLSDTIPIYYGSSDISDIFNPKAFINCSDYKSFDDVINTIIELDNDDQKYLNMLREPIFNNPNYYDNLVSDLESFLCHIIDQDIKEAYRRSLVYLPKEHEEYILKLKNINYKYYRLFYKGATKKELWAFFIAHFKRKKKKKNQSHCS